MHAITHDTLTHEPTFETQKHALTYSTNTCTHGMTHLVGVQPGQQGCQAGRRRGQRGCHPALAGGYDGIQGRRQGGVLSDLLEAGGDGAAGAVQSCAQGLQVCATVSMYSCERGQLQVCRAAQGVCRACQRAQLRACAAAGMQSCAGLCSGPVSTLMRAEGEPIASHVMRRMR